MGPFGQLILNLRRRELTSNRHGAGPTVSSRPARSGADHEESAMTAEAQEMVLREVSRGIARITLNRPAAAGAIAPEQRDQVCGR
jgi:hypothetical protein